MFTFLNISNFKHFPVQVRGVYQHQPQFVSSDAKYYFKNIINNTLKWHVQHSMFLILTNVSINLTTYLPFPVNTNYTTGRTVGCCYKNCIPTNAIHVNTCTTFNVIEVDITIFCYQEDDTIFLADLMTFEVQIHID